MIPEIRRRPGTYAFVTVAYLAVVGVAASLVLRGGTAPDFSVSTTVLVALVLLFGLSVPVSKKPWARTPPSLLATTAVDFVIVGVLLFLTPSPWIPAILFFVLISVSSRLGRSFRYSVYAAAPLVTAVAIVATGHLSKDWPSLVSIVPAFVAMIVFSESFRTVRESSQESRKLLDELVSAQEQLREVTVVEERQRLAREMHDAVGHRLTVASIQLEAVCRLIETDPARAAELAAVSRDQVRAGLAELRSAVSSLSALEVEPRSLCWRIEETVNAFRHGSGVEVVMELDPNADSFDAAQAKVLLRCVQEGLTNIQRHSTAAHARVSLGIRRSDNIIELAVEDDGRGTAGEGSITSQDRTDSISGGFGLRSLRERAEAIGGTVSFTRGEAGSRLTAMLPTGRD